MSHLWVRAEDLHKAREADMKHAYGSNIPFLLVSSVLVEWTEIKMELLRVENNRRHSHLNAQGPAE